MEIKTGYGKKVTVTGGNEKLVGGAILQVKAGKKTDLQFHIHTIKVFHVLQGALKVNVLSNGALQSLDVAAGSAFTVNRGMVYQFEATDYDVIIVEFTSRPENYLVEDGKMIEDLTVVMPGDKIEEVATVEAVAEPEEAPVEEKPKKKRTSKKKATKKTVLEN